MRHELEGVASVNGTQIVLYSGEPSARKRPAVSSVLLSLWGAQPAFRAPEHDVEGSTWKKNQSIIWMCDERGADDGKPDEHGWSQQTMHSPVGVARPRSFMREYSKRTPRALRGKKKRAPAGFQS